MQPTPTTNLEQQALIVIRALEGNHYDKDSPIFKKAIEWIDRWPSTVGEELKRRLIKAVREAFNVTEADIYACLSGVDRAVVLERAQPTGGEDRLRALLPKEGWFKWYDDYTRLTESPLSYHVFCSLVVLGAALGRRVWLDMGFFKVYPNCAVILVGPPARVKKTSATDIARELVEKCGLCPIMADKVTPEALATALKTSGHHVIHAPELAVFFGKQKYNEGLITLMLRILDSPNQLIISTQSRGDEIVEGLAVSLLGATTPSLLASSTPDQVSSSGFLSRILLVVENDTERCFPIPARGIGEAKILSTINRLKDFSGCMTFTPEADIWHQAWYRKLWKSLRTMTDETTAEIKGRTHTHMLRTAMLVHLVQCDNFRICESCLSIAANLIQHLDNLTPQMIKSMRQVAISQDADFVYDMLIKLGGASDHSNLLRRVATKMNATQFKQHIRTLEESGRVKVSKKGLGSYYVATEVIDAME